MHNYVCIYLLFTYAVKNDTLYMSLSKIMLCVPPMLQVKVLLKVSQGGEVPGSCRVLSVDNRRRCVTLYDPATPSTSLPPTSVTPTAIIQTVAIPADTRPSPDTNVVSTQLRATTSEQASTKTQHNSLGRPGTNISEPVNIYRDKDVSSTTVKNIVSANILNNKENELVNLSSEKLPSFDMHPEENINTISSGNNEYQLCSDHDRTANIGESVVGSGEIAFKPEFKSNGNELSGRKIVSNKTCTSHLPESDASGGDIASCSSHHNESTNILRTNGAIILRNGHHFGPQTIHGSPLLASISGLVPKEDHLCSATIKGVSAPKMFTFDGVYTHDDSQVSLCPETRVRP